MRITAIRTMVLRMTRRTPLATSYGVIPGSTIVVVEMQTDAGVTGWGQTTSAAPWYGETAEAIVANIDHHLAPALVGQEPTNIEAALRRMDEALPGGLYAKTAVEFALWDIKGKALGVPVYELLGGRVREGIRLHGFVHIGPPEAMAEQARAQVEAGWTIMKMKIGLDPVEDLRRDRAVREAVGDAGRFQLDGNTGYTLAEAQPTLRAMERLGGVAIFEQPVRTVEEMATLARLLETPLMADESINSPEDALAIAARGAAHVLHLKLHKFGGLSKVRRIAAIAEAAGMLVSVAPYTDIELAAAAHFAAATGIAVWPTGYTPNTETILAAPIAIVDQHVVPPQGPGLGIEVDRARLAAYASG